MPAGKSWWGRGSERAFSRFSPPVSVDVMGKSFFPSLAGVLVATALWLGLSVPPAQAGLGDCSQPLSSGPVPVSTDCLFILNAAVSLASCSPACICAPSGELPISATDALVCLRRAVGQVIPLNCPCGSGSTSTTSSTRLETTTTLFATTTTLSPDSLMMSIEVGRAAGICEAPR